MLLISDDHASLTVATTCNLFPENLDHGHCRNRCAALQAVRYRSGRNQPAKRSHSLASKPGDLWFPLVHSVEQQDRDKHNEQTGKNANCAH
jgi:hypothetical protein